MKMSKTSKKLNNEIASEKLESLSVLTLQERRKKKRPSGEFLEYDDDFYDNDDDDDDDDEISSDVSVNPASVPETIAFWLLGLTSLFSYNVIISALHDLTGGEMYEGGSGHHQHMVSNNWTYYHRNIETDDDDEDDNNLRPECHLQSSGTFFIINILPELIAQVIATFCPFYCLQFRMFLVILLMTSGILLCATSASAFSLHCGVGIVSVSTGIVENTLISYISMFDNKYLIVTLSAGCGGAGLGASLWYVLLVGLGVKSSSIFYTLLAVPFVMSVAFWGILNRPAFWCFKQDNSVRRQASSFNLTDIHKKKGFIHYLHHIKTNFYLNVSYIPHLFPFIISSFLVYFFEYYILLCLHELIVFHKFTLTIGQQYQWYAVTYNFAVFLVKSSLYFISIKTLWFLPVLQGINATFLTFAAIFYLIPHFSLVLCFIFWEGLMGGVTYTTIFYVLYTQVNPERRKFSMAFVAISECVGVTLAALVSEPAHDFICQLSPELRVWNLPHN